MENKSKTIKQIVIDEVKRLNGQFPTKEHLESLVKENFPTSKWKDTHYAWYKSQIKTGQIKVPKFDNNCQLNDSDDEVDNINAVSVSLERDLQSYVSLNLEDIEEGLELVDNGMEYKTQAGFIDLLAKDKNGNYVVIELKAGKAKDSVIGQIMGYMGALSLELNTSNIRGLVVASEFDNRLLYASKQIENLRLVKYGMIFNFNEEAL